MGSWGLTLFLRIYISLPIYLTHCIAVCSPVSPTELRKLGRCPLTPEEAALVLSGLGFKRGTYIYLAGSHIYGEKSRMDSFTSLYPNLVTKETILTPHELAPFRNFSSQVKNYSSLKKIESYTYTAWKLSLEIHGRIQIYSLYSPQDKLRSRQWAPCSKDLKSYVLTEQDANL